MALSEDVLSGKEGLVIDFEMTEDWSWVEVTNMIVSNYAMKNNIVKDTANVASVETQMGGETNVAIVPESVSKFKEFDNGKYETFSYATHDKCENATFTLNAFNYNAYAEVRFGVAFAVTGTFGEVWVEGECIDVPDNLIGHWYNMEAVIKDGYLMLVDAFSTNDVKSRDPNFVENGYFLKTKLSDEVLNGEEGLVIELSTSASYCLLEITNTIATENVDFIA